MKRLIKSLGVKKADVKGCGVVVCKNEPELKKNMMDNDKVLGFVQSIKDEEDVI